MPFISLDRSSSEPMARRIYGRIRERILGGELGAGARLPSTRELSAELRVSRNTVLDAYEQLLAEGFVEARIGSGTRVASGAVFRAPPRPPLDSVVAAGFGRFRTDIVDFRSGLPDLTRFPIRLWQRLLRETWGGVSPLDLAYSQPEGRAELRGAVAGYVAAHRGVRCHPDQVVITAGTTQAVGIVGRLLLSRPGASCVLEDPLTVDIRRILASTGASILAVPVDDQGLSVGALPRRRRPSLVYVTPSHQFPLGVTMPIQRRVSLLEYAHRSGCFVVEDDYDSEFRYGSPPVSSIQGLDPERVIYIGTFSKTLCPALRVGYLVLPPGLVERGRQVKWFSDLHNPAVEQLVLARFIAEGCYARHVRAARKAHERLRQHLVDSLARELGERVEVLGSAAGLHLCARFPGARFDAELLGRIEREGARVYPVEEHAIRPGRFTDTVIMGYGMLSAERIAEGVRVLRRCLASSRGGRGSRRT